jgi:hypothetical protein
MVESEKLVASEYGQSIPMNGHVGWFQQSYIFFGNFCVPPLVTEGAISRHQSPSVLKELTPIIIPVSSCSYLGYHHITPANCFSTMWLGSRMGNNFLNVGLLLKLLRVQTSPHPVLFPCVHEEGT